MQQVLPLIVTSNTNYGTTGTINACANHRLWCIHNGEGVDELSAGCL